MQEAINSLITGALTGGTIYVKGILYGTGTITIPQIPMSDQYWLSNSNELAQLRIIGGGPFAS